MNRRQTATEVVIRLVLLAGAFVCLRFAQLTWHDWREQVGETFDLTPAWGAWVAALALLVLTGILIGAAATFSRMPRGYRWSMPLLVSLPALLLLGHFVLVMESAERGGPDLPGALGHIMFYMDSTSQSVLALVAGVGIAAGFQPRVASQEIADDTLGAPQTG